MVGLIGGVLCVCVCACVRVFAFRRHEYVCVCVCRELKQLPRPTTGTALFLGSLRGMKSFLLYFYFVRHTFISDKWAASSEAIYSGAIADPRPGYRRAAEILVSCPFCSGTMVINSPFSSADLALLMHTISILY